MSQPAQREVLDAAARLVESHRPAPDLPVDLAVHTALVLDGEAPCYTELTRSESWPGALVFTLVTRTRVLQLTAGAADRPADGTRISTDVWDLAGLDGARPLEAATGAGGCSRSRAPRRSGSRSPGCRRRCTRTRRPASPRRWCRVRPRPPTEPPARASPAVGDELVHHQRSCTSGRIRSS